MMKIGALGGLFLALPVIILQLWLFIAPGLYSNEKRFAMPFVMLRHVLLRRRRGLLALHRVSVHLEVLPRLRDEYLRVPAEHLRRFSLWVKMLLAFGVIFQMPTIVFFLARMGMVTAGFLIKHTKYAVLIIFILGAVLSPGHRRRLAGPDGRTDAGPLRPQHRHRLALREEETGGA